MTATAGADRAPSGPVGPVRLTPGGLRWYIDFYVAAVRISIATGFQYRVANYFYMIGMVAEPVIYLVVWSTIARQQGGEVGGFTPESSPPTTSSGPSSAR